jgi:hypothetical protein
LKKKLKEEENLQVFYLTHKSVLHDTTELSLFLLRALFEAFPVRADLIMKMFRDEEISGDLKPKMFELIEVPIDFIEEFNSFYGGESIPESFQPAHQTIGERSSSGDSMETENVNGSIEMEDKVNVRSDRVEENGLPVLRGYEMEE